MKKEDILASCIDEIKAGKATVEDCLAKYPGFGDELRPLLELATGFKEPTVTPSLEYKQSLRNRLLEIMAPPVNAGRKRPGMFDFHELLAAVKKLNFALTAAITILLVIVIAGGTTVYASRRSLPDDALYPVKIGAENIQLVFTLNRDARTRLHLTLAQRRLDEMVTQSDLGRDLNVSSLKAVTTEIDAALKEIVEAPPQDILSLLSQFSTSTLNQQATLGQLLEAAPEAIHLALEQTIGATWRGNLISQMAYVNPDLLESSPSVLDEKIRMGYFELEGILVSAEGGVWNIGGLVLENVNSSIGVPPTGHRVDIEGLVQGDRIFISKIDREDGTDNEISIEGVFGGSSPDGTIWYVGGISIGMPEDVVPPPEGNQLELLGVIQDGIIAITRMETEAGEEGKFAIRGILVAVNRAENTITISIAGNEILINIDEVLIKGDGEVVTWFDLESLAEKQKDIQVDGLYMKDDLIFAKVLYIDIDREQSEPEAEDNERNGDDEPDGDGEHNGDDEDEDEDDEDDEPDGDDEHDDD